MTLATREDPLGVFPCSRCDQAFSRESHLALHLGRAHGPALSGPERERFQAALAEEEEALSQIRRHARAALTVFPLVIFYAFIFLAVYASGASLGFAFLPLPGIVAVSVLLYFITYAKEQPAAPRGETPTLKTGPHR